MNDIDFIINKYSEMYCNLFQKIEKEGLESESAVTVTNIVPHDFFNDKKALIQILNMEGKIIKQVLFSELSDNKIDINNLFNGFYIVKVIAENNQYLFKFLKY